MGAKKNATAQQYEIVTSPEGFLSYALDVLDVFRRMAHKSGYGILESTLDDAIREARLQHQYVVQNRALH
jgi:hypothetical protein